MNETDFRTLVEKAPVPDQPAPVEAILVAAHGRARRRRGLGAALAAAVVVVGATVAGTMLAGSPDASPPVTNPSPSNDDLVAPAGTRYVGLKGVVVAVPSAWGTNQAQCGFATEPSVVFESGNGHRSCLIGHPAEAVYLATVETPNAATWVAEAVTSAQVNGFDVLLGPITQRGDLTLQSMAVPSAGVVFHVETPGSPVDLLDTLASVPAGFVAVPPSPADMAPAGLKTRVTLVRSQEFSDGHVFGTDPAYGAVVPVGTTVTVTESSGADGWVAELPVNKGIGPGQMTQWRTPLPRALTQAELLVHLPDELGPPTQMILLEMHFSGRADLPFWLVAWRGSYDGGWNTHSRAYDAFTGEPLSEYDALSREPTGP